MELGTRWAGERHEAEQPVSTNMTSVTVWFLEKPGTELNLNLINPRFVIFLSFSEQKRKPERLCRINRHFSNCSSDAHLAKMRAHVLS